MKQAATTAASEMQKSSAQEDAAAVTAMQKHGMQIHSVPPEMRREWDQFAQTVLWPKIRGQIVDAESFDEVQRLTTEFRKQPGGAF
jgi:TRAP-type C4-dicarboxylate transport system substrate-binding protein